MSKKRGLIVLSTLVVALISAVLLAPQAEAAKNLKLKQKVESTLFDEAWHQRLDMYDRFRGDAV